MLKDKEFANTTELTRRMRRLLGTLLLVRGEALSEADREELDEVVCLETVSRMPTRVKCAELAWRTLDEMLAHPEESAPATL